MKQSSLFKGAKTANVKLEASSKIFSGLSVCPLLNLSISNQSPQPSQQLFPSPSQFAMELMHQGKTSQFPQSAPRPELQNLKEMRAQRKRDQGIDKGTHLIFNSFHNFLLVRQSASSEFVGNLMRLWNDYQGAENENQCGNPEHLNKRSSSFYRSGFV